MVRKMTSIFWISGTFMLSGCLVSKPAVTSLTSDSNTATKIVFVQSPGSGSVGSVWASQPVIEIQNADGQVITTGADANARVTVSLLGNDGSLTGTTSVFAIQGRARFVGLSTTVAGSLQLQAKKTSVVDGGGSGELTNISDVFMIQPGAMTKLNIKSDKGIYDLGACQKLDVQSVDKNNNSVVTSESVSMILSATGHVSFYSDSACSAEISVLEIPAKQKQVSVFYKSMTHEPFRIFAAPVSPNLGSGQLDLSAEALTITGHYLDSSETNACTAFGSVVACQRSVVQSPFQTLYRFPSRVKTLAISRSAQVSGCAVLENNELYCFGNAFDGAPNAIVPKKMTVFSEPVLDVVAGYENYCVLVAGATRNQVKCWGKNTQRQLGDGTTTDRLTPVTANIPLTGLQSVVKIKMARVSKIVGGVSITAAILNDGKIYIFGGGYVSGNAINNMDPTLWGGTYDAVDADFYVSYTYSYQNNTTVSTIYVTGCIFNRNATVGCGRVTYGSVGVSSAVVSLRDTLPGVHSLFGGNGLSCARLADNSTYCWVEYSPGFKDTVPNVVGL